MMFHSRAGKSSNGHLTLGCGMLHFINADAVGWFLSDTAFHVEVRWRFSTRNGLIFWHVGFDHVIPVVLRKDSLIAPVHNPKIALYFGELAFCVYLKLPSLKAIECNVNANGTLLPSDEMENWNNKVRIDLYSFRRADCRYCGLRKWPALLESLQCRWWYHFTPAKKKG